MKPAFIFRRALNKRPCTAAALSARFLFSSISNTNSKIRIAVLIDGDNAESSLIEEAVELLLQCLIISFVLMIIIVCYILIVSIITILTKIKYYYLCRHCQRLASTEGSQQNESMEIFQSHTSNYSKTNSVFLIGYLESVYSQIDLQVFIYFTIISL